MGKEDDPRVYSMNFGQDFDLSILGHLVFSLIV